MTAQTFPDLLAAEIRQSTLPPRELSPGECQSPTSQRCTLCHAVRLSYDDEIALKNRALRAYWSQHFSSVPLEGLVASPKGRAYRTVTKRRVFEGRGGFRLGLIDPSEEGSFRPFVAVRCAIEPPEHADIYALVGRLLEKPYAKHLAATLSYVVIKGNYREFTLLLNVRDISREVVAAANTLSKTVTGQIPSVAGVFLYEDPSGGKYYLGTSSPSTPAELRKVFGKSEIFQRVGDRKFLYSPLSFSQVNHSILDPMIRQLGGMLELGKNHTLFDLYCGYGLFALAFAESARSVVGVEMSAASIASAHANARRQHAHNVRFIRNDISGDSIQTTMRTASAEDVVLLDPPRGGVAAGVIEYIAARSIRRIVHLFCNMDIMPAEVGRWVAAGYHPVKAIPFDMFPGTSSLEIALLFQRQ